MDSTRRQFLKTGFLGAASRFFPLGNLAEDRKAKLDNLMKELLELAGLTRETLRADVDLKMKMVQWNRPFLIKKIVSLCRTMEGFVHSLDRLQKKGEVETDVVTLIKSTMPAAEAVPELMEKQRQMLERQEREIMEFAQPFFTNLSAARKAIRTGGEELHLRSSSRYCFSDLISETDNSEENYRDFSWAKRTSSAKNRSGNDRILG